MSTLYIFLSKQYFCKVSRLLKRNKEKLKHGKTKKWFYISRTIISNHYFINSSNSISSRIFLIYKESNKNLTIILNYTNM